MAVKGDFISFTYNGVHSTELGIVRVSSSNRYNDQLIPTSKEKTSESVGMNGTYFFKTYYTSREIILNIAFDEVTEGGIRLMRQIFGDQKEHQLIFDDEPYKVYYAKVNGQPQLKYICFNDYEKNPVARIYKGEGTINFICYDPFAHCLSNYKNYNDWTIGKTINNPLWYKYDNKEEWNLSAKLSTNNQIGQWNENGYFLLYNPGDVEADYKLYVPISSGSNISSLTIENSETLESYSLQLNEFQNYDEDTHICFNSKTNIIEGIKFSEIDGYQKTNNIYNKYLKSSAWPKIPVSFNTNWKLVLNNYNNSSSSGDILEFNDFILPAGSTYKEFSVIGNVITSVILIDTATKKVVLGNIEILNNRIAINLASPYSNNIQVNVTSVLRNPNIPFLEYDYLYF